MDWHNVEENWKQMSGQFKQKFSKLSDDDIEKIGGDREKMQKHLQKRYNLGRSEAKQRLDKFVDGLKNSKQHGKSTGKS